MVQRMRSVLFIRSRSNPSDIAIGRKEGAGKRREFVPGVNSSLFKKSFLEPIKGRHGTVLLDFAETPDPDLTAGIVQTNNFNRSAKGRYVRCLEIRLSGLSFVAIWIVQKCVGSR